MMAMMPEASREDRSIDTIGKAVGGQDGCRGMRWWMEILWIAGNMRRLVFSEADVFKKLLISDGYQVFFPQLQCLSGSSNSASISLAPCELAPSSTMKASRASSAYFVANSSLLTAL